MKFLRYFLLLFVLTINTVIKPDNNTDFELYKKQLQVYGYQAVVKGIGCVHYVCNLPNKIKTEFANQCDKLESHCKKEIAELEKVIKNQQTNNKQ